MTSARSRRSSKKVRPFATRSPHFLTGSALRMPADYNKARALAQEAVALTSKILDARLQLTRLRQAHPHPRLTVASANAQLDAQVEEMQKLDDELLAVDWRILHWVA